MHLLILVTRMFDLFWRKEYEKNLKLFKEYLANDYVYVDYYKNRIEEIIKKTPYSGFKYKLKFNDVKDLEIIFSNNKNKYKVSVSCEVFEHYNIFTDEYMTLSDNVRNSYKRSLIEALMMLENEYVKEMENAYMLYRNRIDNFLININEVINEKY